MEITAGSKVVLSVAAAEATFIKSIEIEPEHIFLGMLKVEDVLHRDMLSPEMLGDQSYEATTEIANLVEFWKRHNIPVKQMRRRLRFLISENQETQGEFSGHRSKRGRRPFEIAERACAQHAKSQITILALLTACLEFESPILSALFDEFNIQREQLIADIGKQQEEPTSDVKADLRGKKVHPLSKYGRDLTALAREGKLDPIIGRDEEIKEVARILTQRSKNNPILLGNPGVGKTAIVEGLALYAVREDAKAPIRNLHFVEITMTALVAGAKYRGEFEERLQEVIEIARKDKSLVLFIDEIHTLMGAGAAGTSGLDAANILKPALARGDLRCIGATTTDEYRKHIELDGALARRFQTVWVDEPTYEETLAILRGLRPKMQEHHEIEIPDDVLEKAVSLSNRFLTDGHQPDKAITILDEACARRKLLTIHARSEDEQTVTVEIEDIARAVARRTQIPVEVLLAGDEERLLNLEQDLAQRVIGQEQAVKAVAQAIRISRSGLRAPGKPIVLLFTGPTGTGKTELAKALSEFLFYDPNRLITLDMTEYQESHSLAKIIGSPPGYVGFGEEPYLIREIRLHPYSVVLLDEIEKAHPSVLNVFLQVFDEGRLTDARGRRINFAEAIFILTSNLSADFRVKAPLGFKREPLEVDQERGDWLEEQVRRAIASNLRPELVNRLQEIVVFKPLSRETIYRILEMYLQSLNRMLEERQIAVTLDDSAKDFVLENGYSEEYGARHLRRAFDRWVTEPLSRELLAGNVPKNSQIIFATQNNRLIFNIHSKTGTKTVLYEPTKDEGD